MATRTPQQLYCNVFKNQFSSVSVSTKKNPFQCCFFSSKRQKSVNNEEPNPTFQLSVKSYWLRLCNCLQTDTSQTLPACILSDNNSMWPSGDCCRTQCWIMWPSQVYLLNLCRLCEGGRALFLHNDKLWRKWRGREG